MTLFRTDGAAAFSLAARLDEIGGSPDLLDRLTQHGFGTSSAHDFNVSSWFQQGRRGRNLWRLRVWNVPAYRVIYAFVPRKHHYYVLGIMPRSVNYECNDPFIERVEKAYDELLAW